MRAMRIELWCSQNIKECKTKKTIAKDTIFYLQIVDAIRVIFFFLNLLSIELLDSFCKSKSMEAKTTKIYPHGYLANI